jgi:hypothetical protein
MRYHLRTLLIVACFFAAALHVEHAVFGETPQISLVSERLLSAGYEYKCVEMARLVNALRKLGKDKALAALNSHADGALEHGQSGAIFLICRCLFENPNGWTPPDLGAPLPDVPDEVIAKLPHFPLMFSDGVPFMVIQGYILGGRSENPKDFLKLCEALPLRQSDLPTTGYDAAARSLVASDLFSQLYPDAAVRRSMSKMVLRQAEKNSPRKKGQ